MFPLRSVINNRNIWKSLAVGRAAATTRSTAQMEEDVSMQVPAHSITARSLPRICIGTVGGNPPACRVRRLPVAVPRQSIVWGGCRVSGQRTSSSDLGAAASSRNYQLPRSRPQRLRTAASLRPARPQCAAEPGAPQRRALRPAHRSSPPRVGVVPRCSTARSWHEGCRAPTMAQTAATPHPACPLRCAPSARVRACRVSGGGR
jgi:hypothetical protein